jgi:hypothetical protein
MTDLMAPNHRPALDGARPASLNSECHRRAVSEAGRANMPGDAYG